MTRAPVAAGGLRWLGHATVLVELDTVRLLTDPVLRNRVGPLVRVARSVPSVPENLDGVLLSHLHADHTDPSSLRRLAPGTPVLAPHPAASWLGSKGLAHVRELRPGDQISVRSLTVTATTATHDPRRRPRGPAAEPIGYLIRGSRSVYFAGDTDLDPSMGDLRGTVDVALLPIWGWGRSVGAGHLDPRSAAEAVALIQPAMAIPIHWGTFALPLVSTWRVDHEAPAARFAALAKRCAPAVEVRVLAPGERIAL
jgi:L-ascorbate metabolism protein UlaG (beta-lactamase superfamily)